MIDKYGQIWDWAINKGKAGNPSDDSAMCTANN